MTSGSAGSPALLQLGDLLRGVEGARSADPSFASRTVTEVRDDSRRVERGDLFVAVPGTAADGRQFIVDAAARGAAALVFQGAAPPAADFPGVVVTVPDARHALGIIAANRFGAAAALTLLAVTGTNGKTTTSYLVEEMLRASGRAAGMFGTITYRAPGLLGGGRVAPLTTPGALMLHGLLAEMRAVGTTDVVLEATSHALTQGRLDGCLFRVAALTNLTQDHLDYHGTMEAYGAAKARLFFDLAPGAAAVNVDDPFGRELARRLAPEGPNGPREAPLCRFSAEIGKGPDLAEIAPVALAFTQAGIALEARTPAGQVVIRSPLMGAHNVENLLTALSIAFLLDLDVHAAARALSGPIAVPGRLERCDAPGLDDVAVLVDYAHTPDALARVLGSVRGLGGGGLRCVFGCGGDRDPLKRPLMGEVVGRLADVAFVTNDNPRSEDPGAIAGAILQGITGGHAQVIVELDRRRAIERAVLEAAPGDRVLIAGKGHEPYQILGPLTVPFDDRDEARRALSLRRARAVS